ncbi:hypothetical protein [Streptomyces sp. MMG1121]|uniref:hypothetical protein n=1 Tax=Streptomyces sp. MMG1121 TaxID=1415544 RepID=UPI0006AF45DD|nr:hypothetical protein [Streptomyces sp. MMG1121]
MVFDMQPGNIATWVGLVITMVISLITRRDARRQADIAEEANIASQAKVEAAERRAIAVEDSLAEALKLLAQAQNGTTPPQLLATPEPSGRPAVGWDLQRRGKHAYLLRNGGAETATGVHLDRHRMSAIVRNVPENATVRSGESVQFLMVPSLGHPLPGEVWVKWDGQEEPVAVPLPH